MAFFDTVTVPKKENVLIKIFKPYYFISNHLLCSTSDMNNDHGVLLNLLYNVLLNVLFWCLINNWCCSVFFFDFLTFFFNLCTHFCGNGILVYTLLKDFNFCTNFFNFLLNSLNCRISCCDRIEECGRRFYNCFSEPCSRSYSYISLKCYVKCVGKGCTISSWVLFKTCTAGKPLINHLGTSQWWVVVSHGNYVNVSGNAFSNRWVRIHNYVNGVHVNCVVTVLSIPVCWRRKTVFCMGTQLNVDVFSNVLNTGNTIDCSWGCTALFIKEGCHLTNRWFIFKIRTI